MASTTKFPNITVKLIGEDSNVFNLIGITATALRKKASPEDAREFTRQAMSQLSYDAVLSLIQDWVVVK